MGQAEDKRRKEHEEREAIEKQKAEDLKKAEKKEYEIDLDAFGPETVRAQTHIKFGGKTYPVRRFIDIEYGHVMQVLSLEKELTGKPYAQQLELARAQIKILVPSMPNEILDKLTGRQILRIALESFGASEAPQEGSGNELDSDT